MLAYSVLLRFKMKAVYKTIFYFKRGDVVKESASWDKIKTFINNFLLDERSSFDEMSKSSLTFRIDDGLTDGSSSKNASSINDAYLGSVNKTADKLAAVNQYIKYNKKTDMRLSLHKSDYAFEMYRLSIIAILVMVPIIGFHIFEYANNIGPANKLRNCVNLLTVVSDMRVSYSIMRESLLQTIAFNNKELMLTRPSQDVFQSQSIYFKDQLIPRLMSLKDLNLGDSYSRFYINATGTLPICELIDKYGNSSIKCTDRLVLESSSNTFIMYLRTSVAMFDNMFMMWSNDKTSPKAILTQKRFRSELVYG